MALINIGAGLAELGKTGAAMVGNWTLESQRADAEKDKLKLIQDFQSGENVKQREFSSSERVEGEKFKSGESVLDREHREKLAEAQRQASLAVASISAGASMANARLSAQVQREGQEIQRESLTPAEVRTAKWFAGASPEERTAFQETLLAKMPPPKPPEGYRKTEGGDLEPIPGGPATKPKDAPAGFRWSADGSRLESIEGGPADPEKVKRANPMNNEQARDAGFADRMANSQGILSQLDKKGTSIWGRLAEHVIGGNVAQSDEYQRFRQAKEDFINAQLRRESGAAISADEFAKADRQYFPQPGDKDNVIAQKAKNRDLALEAMIRGAGPTYKPSPSVGEPPAPAAPSTALPPVEKRAIGRTYQTPTGPAIWMGNGWFRAPEAK